MRVFLVLETQLLQRTTQTNPCAVVNLNRRILLLDDLQHLRTIQSLHRLALFRLTETNLDDLSDILLGNLLHI